MTFQPNALPSTMHAMILARSAVLNLFIIEVCLGV
jgi:hypothetical protein